MTALIALLVVVQFNSSEKRDEHETILFYECYSPCDLGLD